MLDGKHELPVQHYHLLFKQAHFELKINLCFFLANDSILPPANDENHKMGSTQIYLFYVYMLNLKLFFTLRLNIVKKLSVEHYSALLCTFFNFKMCF